jgi:type IX secretion system PorP/SprF family membrane protein
MFYRFIVSLFLLGLTVPLFAQQLPYYTQFRQYQGLLNPASVNSDFFLYEYNVSLQASHRMQWINQAETPRSYNVAGEYISDFGGSFELVTGGTLLQDRNGPYGYTGMYGRIGSMFTKDPYLGAFSVGLSFGMVNQRVTADRLSWLNPEDPQIPLNNLSVWRPDVGVGVYYYKRLKRGYLSDDNIYGGLSMLQLVHNKARVQDESNWISLRRVSHLYATGGWYHFFNQEGFFELSFWGKYVQGAPLNVSLNGRIQPVRTFWAGAGLNFNGIAHLEGGVNVPGLLFDDANLKIGYSFDYNFSAYELNFGTSHEITLSIMFDTYR